MNTKPTTFKQALPDDLRKWIKGHGYTITSFARMMALNRRDLQRKLAKKAFKPHYAILMTMFCVAYDLGYHIEGMGDPTPRERRGGRRTPRKETL